MTQKHTNLPDFFKGGEEEISAEEFARQMQHFAPPPPAPRAVPVKKRFIILKNPKKKRFKFPAALFEDPKMVVDLPEVERQKLLDEFQKRYRKPLVTLEVPECVMVDYKKKRKSELIVITFAKKLLSYVVLVTERAPKKFRFTFTNRLQNYAIDILEDLFSAHQLRTDIKVTLEKRKALQKDAYTKLKLLSYMAFIAHENKVILEKHYLNIADLVHETLGWLHQWMYVAASKAGEVD